MASMIHIYPPLAGEMPPSRKRAMFRFLSLCIVSVIVLYQKRWTFVVFPLLIDCKTSSPAAGCVFGAVGAGRSLLIVMPLAQKRWLTLTWRIKGQPVLNAFGRVSLSVCVRAGNKLCWPDDVFPCEYLPLWRCYWAASNYINNQE